MVATPLVFRTSGKVIARRRWDTLPRQKDRIVLGNVLAKKEATFIVDRITLVDHDEQPVEVVVDVVEIDSSGAWFLDPPLRQ
jgi:hypothetical protein